MAKAALTFEKLFLVTEAAAMVRVSPWTIWAKLKNGELLRTKVGGRTVIRESELHKLIIDQPVEPKKLRASQARPLSGTILS